MFNLLSRVARNCWSLSRPNGSSIYTCGPHTQRRLQLGEARRFVLADLLRRYLRWTRLRRDPGGGHQRHRGGCRRRIRAGGDGRRAPSTPISSSSCRTSTWLRIQPAEHYPRGTGSRWTPW
ncbi:MAG: hypothetical protein MZV70_50700 [Desulfobacterales bacterium]|nr:hypothetical protein [Desulfobacterales bacterium]